MAGANRRTRPYRTIPISHMLNHTDIKASTPVKKLNTEIIQIYKRITLCSEEKNERQEILEKYRRLIEDSLECRVEPFGSSRTGLMVHGSDIDMTVLFRTGGTPENPRYDDSKQFSNGKLSAIRKLIERAGHAKGPVLQIKQARTPIIKLTDRDTGIKVDISINKTDGIQTAEYIKREVQKKPYITPFVIILKYFLKRRNLSDAACGGLCAYAQFLIILDFVSLHPLIQNGNLDVEENIGVLFMDFFQYFGVDFPFETSAICVADGAYRPHRDGAIVIDDPIAPGNNVAGGCGNIKLIKDVFVYSYRVMAAALSSKVDCRKGVADLWLRLDQREFKQRDSLLKKAAMKHRR